MGIVMALDAFSGELLLAIILGVSITSKFDVWAFRISGLIALLVPGIYTLIQSDGLESHLRWLPIAILTTAGVLDEFLDGLSDRKYFQIFKYRPILEITMLLTVFMKLFPLTYSFALLSFDLGYLTVAKISLRIKEMTNISVVEKV
ncbi:hypothetical protein [Mastigocladopsis repens]|uniref:hypothetical protein n=1 Tax=Mastigocladopsis repens TaxID=221287 RepID=UPI001E3E26AD|nr:hypothetical protein [Mastigocladopsis repens]